MGNHEYNIVRHHHGTLGPKDSNLETIADIARRSEAWEPVLDFFETLPLALELPELRVIHAVWHRECYAEVERVLGNARPMEANEVKRETSAWLHAHVTLRSPFRAGKLDRGLPAREVSPGGDRPHEILIKGYEDRAAAPFKDADGKVRDLVRVPWWDRSDDVVLRDRLTVFGHYWNLPPLAGVHDAFVPPHPSGHPDLRLWIERAAPHIEDPGRAPIPPSCKAVCVDFNGLILDERADHSCVGAFRWPEREVFWAIAERSRR